MKHPALLAILLGLSLVSGCTSPKQFKSSDAHEENVNDSACPKPENPYIEGTAHYNGYEWAKNYGQGPCVNSSPSFVEGCKRFESQATVYKRCQDRQKK